MADDNQYKIVATFDGKTAEAGLDRLSSKFKKADNDGTVFGRGLDLTKSKLQGFAGPIGDVLGTTSKLGVALGVTAGVVAVVGGSLIAATSHAIEAGAAFQDLADQTGLSVEHITSMRNVLASSNMDVKGYADAISKLSIQLNKNGESFRKLGIDTNDPAKAFDQIKHKIADMKNPIDRAKLANEAFGKSYKDLMPLLMMGNSEYDKMKGNTSVFSAEFAKNAAEVDDNIALLKTSFGDLAVQLGANFIPAMESIVSLFQDAAEYWGGLSSSDNAKNEKIANDLDAIRTKYAEVQATSDKGAKVLGQAPQDVKIDGLTFSQAVNQYMASVKAQNEEDAKALEAKKKKSEADRKLAEIAEQQAKQEEARRKLIEANSYSAFLANNKNQEYVTTQAALNEQRFSKENSVSVDYFGGDDTAMRDFQERYNAEKDRMAATTRHGEAVAQTSEYEKSAKEGNAAYDAQVFTEEIEKQNKALEQQKAIYGKIAGTIESSLTGPYSNFIKDITRGNKSLFDSFSSLFDGILAAWGNMLVEMVAQLAAKATIFGLLNLASGGIGGGVIGGLLDNFSWFANGTNYAYGGMARVGERGPETVYLPKGSRVEPTNTNQNKSVTINNNFQVSQTMSPESIFKKQDIYTKRMVSLGII